MSLHVDRLGSGSDLVLLHGWGLHSGVWSETLPSLAARHRVHAIDLPGHGLSARVSPRGFEEAVADVAGLVPEGSIVCGWSLGGLIAQAIAARNPAKVRTLVLVSTTPCYVERDDWPHAMKASTLAAFAEGLRHERKQTLENFVRLNALHGARSRDAIRAFTQRLDERGETSAEALGATLQWLRDTDLRAHVASLTMPTLVIHGTRDALVPVGAGRWLATHLPEARMVEWPDAAHLPFFTHPESFVQALEAFVA